MDAKVLMHITLVILLTNTPSPGRRRTLWEERLTWEGRRRRRSLSWASARSSCSPCSASPSSPAASSTHSRGVDLQHRWALHHQRWQNVIGNDRQQSHIHLSTTPWSLVTPYPSDWQLSRTRHDSKTYDVAIDNTWISQFSLSVCLLKARSSQ